MTMKLALFKHCQVDHLPPPMKFEGLKHALIYPLHPKKYKSDTAHLQTLVLFMHSCCALLNIKCFFYNQYKGLFISLFTSLNTANHPSWIITSS